MGIMANVKDKMMDKMLGMPKEKQVELMRDMTAMLLSSLTDDEMAGFLNTIALSMVKNLPKDRLREVQGLI